LSDIGPIILQFSGLLFSLARQAFAAPMMGSWPSQHESAKLQSIVSQLRDRWSALSDLSDSLPSKTPSEDSLANLSWWLEQFPRLMLEAPCVRQIECEPDAKVVRIGKAVSDVSSLQTLRAACLDLVERGTQQESSRSIWETEAKRQIYNLVYGLSHEINNPLANIAARAEQMLGRSSAPSDRKSLATIVDQAMKAHEMIAELMLAVQIPKLQFRKIEPRELVPRINEAMAARLETAKIVFEARVMANQSPITCDPTALLEAILCGLRNSVENCRAGDRVELRIEPCEPCEDSKRKRTRIAIIDNGPGMTPSQLANAWDLFYSGREAGRGLGLGLAKLRRIVELHHGDVWLESIPQGGTSLEIRLPAD
jgi:signal transduction histidine kinase